MCQALRWGIGQAVGETASVSDWEALASSSGALSPPSRTKAWQRFEPPRGFSGPHSAYADYFHSRASDQRLSFLKHHGFLAETNEIAAEIDNHRALLNLDQGCLVHKDLALWNTPSAPAITSPPSLTSTMPSVAIRWTIFLCWLVHDAVFLQRAFEGYQSVRALPQEHLRRFWLHLLRNMIVKAVIRVGAGYFDRDDGFFLIGTGSSGSNLRETTHSRLALALRGLREGSGLDLLSS